MMYDPRARAVSIFIPESRPERRASFPNDISDNCICQCHRGTWIRRVHADIGHTPCLPASSTTSATAQGHRRIVSYQASISFWQGR
jgi:hypothetical protein